GAGCRRGPGRGRGPGRPWPRPGRARPETRARACSETYVSSEPPEVIATAALAAVRFVVARAIKRGQPRPYEERPESEFRWRSGEGRTAGAARVGRVAFGRRGGGGLDAARGHRRGGDRRRRQVGAARLQSQQAG